MAVDSALLGAWHNIDGILLFGADEYTYAVGLSAASVSSDGQTLTVITTDYARVFGSTSIEGVWKLVAQSDGSQWIEEVYYKADQTFNGTWTKDGVFDSIFCGNYSFAGGVLRTETRRGHVTTGPNGEITIEVAFAPAEQGTYHFEPNGELVLVLNGIANTFTKVVN